MNWSDLKPWVAKIAPTLGAALGGPLGGAAGSLVAKALGTSETTPEAIQKALSGATLSPDALAALQVAEQEFKIKMSELGYQSEKDLEALAVDDRKSARDRQVQMKDQMPAILAVALTVGFFGLLSYLLKWAPPAENKDILNILLGSLGTAWIGAMQFFFGTTSGSRAKDFLLHRSTPTE